MKKDNADWKILEKELTERFGKTPDLQSLIFLIGINEVGFSEDKNFSKEQKEDLMHVATCTLLSQEGYYKKTGYDEDGWPHFEQIQQAPKMKMEEREEWLKGLIVNYLMK